MNRIVAGAVKGMLIALSVVAFLLLIIVIVNVGEEIILTITGGNPLATITIVMALIGIIFGATVGLSDEMHWRATGRDTYIDSSNSW